MIDEVTGVIEQYISGSFSSSTFHLILLKKIKEDEVNEKCSTRDRDEKCLRNFGQRG